MKPIFRRKFLQNSAILLAAAATNIAWNNKRKPLLSFSTLGCPDWPFEKIIDFAAANQYNGIELRGILRQMNLPLCPEFNNVKSIKSTKQRMQDKALSFSDLGSSCSLHITDKTERQKNLDEGKRFIELAASIGCPNVRVFPNNWVKGQDKLQTMHLIAEGLLELGTYAKDTGVRVLMETHGDMVYIDDIKTIMEWSINKQVGLVWDPVNMYLITNESPIAAYKNLAPYIFHVHIKDAIKEHDSITYKLLGDGSIPIFTAIDALYKENYKGYYSFEWEKLWHPEIAEPEIALADYPNKMKLHLKI